MPFFAAHCAIGAVTCGSVMEKRTTYGDLVVIADDAAFMMIIGFFASVTRKPDGSFGEPVWTPIAYPGGKVTTGNTVVDNQTLGAALAIADGASAPNRLREDADRLAMDAVRDAIWGTIDDRGLYLF